MEIDKISSKITDLVNIIREQVQVINNYINGVDNLADEYVNRLKKLAIEFSDFSEDSQCEKFMIEYSTLLVLKLKNSRSQQLLSLVEDTRNSISELKSILDVDIPDFNNDKIIRDLSAKLLCHANCKVELDNILKSTLNELENARNISNLMSEKQQKTLEILNYISVQNAEL